MEKKLVCLSMFLALSFSLISTVEARDVGGAARIKELEERIEALEEQRGFRPVRADWLNIEGEARLDLIVPEKAESYVYLDRVELDITALIAEGVYTRGTLQVTGDAPRPGEAAPRDFAIGLDEVYTRFSLEDHWIKAGLTERFFAPGDMDQGSLRTAGHSLLSNAFWRDEQYNITLGGMFPGVMGGDIRYRLSLGSGLLLGSRRPGDHRFTDPGVGRSDVMLHDDERGIDMDEIGLGLGYRKHFYPEATLDLVVFNAWSRIAAGYDEEGEPVPSERIRGLIGWPRYNEQQRKGVRVVYEAEIPAGETLLMAEYVMAKDGRLDRDGWSLQASHEFPFPTPLIGGRFITGMEPVIRYARYNIDVPKAFRNPLTWDRQQLTLALLVDITRNVSLRIEQDFNSEKTGGREIPNDEFRTQLRTRF